MLRLNYFKIFWAVRITSARLGLMRAELGYRDHGVGVDTGMAPVRRWYVGHWSEAAATAPFIDTPLSRAPTNILLSHINQQQLQNVGIRQDLFSKC